MHIRSERDVKGYSYSICNILKLETMQISTNNRICVKWSKEKEMDTQKESYLSVKIKPLHATFWINFIKTEEKNTKNTLILFTLFKM